MEPYLADLAKSPKTPTILRATILLLAGGIISFIGSSLIVDAISIPGQIFGGVLLVATFAIITFACRKITLDWRYFIGIISLLFAISSVNIIYRIVENHRLDTESVVLKPELVADYNSTVTISDFLESINGELVEDTAIPTDQLGSHEVAYEYTNVKGRRRSGNFTIEVIDRIAPRIYGGTSYTVYKDYTGDLTDLMLSGDNLDDRPRREISGTYDLGLVGNYELEYIITDASGNRTTQAFTLHVIDPPKDSSQTQPVIAPKLPITEVIAEHKTDRTKIGIDVSVWQGKIDWAKAKAAGVEFAFIRIGYQVGYGGEYVLDRYFEVNLAGATAVGLPIGVYFYSYADSITEATAQANWIIEQLHGRELKLGIAFDWEDWSNFNQTNMSFHTINQVANAYLDTVNAAGYHGSLYGSKNYMTNIWEPEKYPVWLAQYYDFVTYEGDYWIWQMSSSGQVPGIEGDVDLDIMYLE